MTSPISEQLLSFLQSNGFVELVPSAELRIDLRYASQNNFVGKCIYGDFSRAFLHPVAAAKLSRVIEQISARHRGLCLVVLDALRPRRAQQVLWDKVKGTPGEAYVADPAKGSVHNYGLALDVTLAQREGGELDMGTEFDDFSPLAQPQLEQELVKKGLLSGQQVANRLILRQLMEDAGFLPLAYEWWHFDALERSQIRSGFVIVE